MESAAIGIQKMGSYILSMENRIKVTEHFSADGKPLNTLLEDVIQFSAQRRDDEIPTAC